LNKASKHNISSSVAFTKLPDGQCQAVKLKRKGNGFELGWKYTISADETDAFIEGIAITDLSSSKTGAVVGVDLEGIAFYNIEVPDVAGDQLDSIVRMQAEALLPLPIDQMDIAYQERKVFAGRKNVVVSTARKQQIKSHLSFAEKCGAGNILLNCQATARTFSKLFDVSEDRFIVLNIRSDDSYVLLCEGGVLAGATKLDVGLDGLSESLSGMASETSDLFVHDLRNALEMLDQDNSGRTTLYVLSGAFAASEKIAAGLKEININAAVTLPRTDVITSDTGVTTKDICVYLDVICVAVEALERQNSAGGLFANSLSKKKKVKKKNPMAPLVSSAVFFVLVALASFYVLITINKKELESYQNDQIDQLLSKQNYQRLIAERRPDLLDLMTKISEEAPSGTTVNSISFKKGQPVVLACESKNLDEIIKFQKFLISKKGFTDVNFKKPKLDAKSKKLSFNMEFHYTGSGRQWTKKGLR